MSSTLIAPPARKASRPNAGEPAWDIAQLFPYQGYWKEADYLALETNHLIEYTDGYIEVLPMPTMSHQLIVQYLSNLLLAFVVPQKLGRVLFAPLRIKLRDGSYREPDILFMLAQNADRMENRYWRRADLVVEVVSEGADNRQRDLEQKRADYEAAGILEYWIVDPQEQRITVLAMKDGKYVEHGVFKLGDKASSVLLGGFDTDVGAVFEAGRS